MKQTLTLEKASLVLYQPGREGQEAKRTPALECAQGDRAFSFSEPWALPNLQPGCPLKMSPSGGRGTPIPGMPKSAFVLSLALLHGMLLSRTTSHQPWALQPGIVLHFPDRTFLYP